MGSDALSSVDLSQTQLQKAQALFARGLGRLMASNVDDVPSPDAPDASPVEARIRRFG